MIDLETFFLEPGRFVPIDEAESAVKRLVEAYGQGEKKVSTGI